MTHFMAYVVLLSAGIGACAVVAELLLRSKTSSTRWTWLAALGAVLMVTGVATVAPTPMQPELPTIPSRPWVVDGFTAPRVTIAAGGAESRSMVRVVDSVLPVAWAIASAALLFAILLGQRRLSIIRQTAESRSVNGRDILLTENLGPAVAGFSRPVVFLPRWVLALDPPSQQLLLAHEFEHAKRGDTRLLLAGAVTAAIMPWNPVVWWITRRLRLAVEQDCDARVLRAHPDVRRYADLLLMAASRPGVYASLLAAHFGEHSSDLGRRIQAMTDNSFKWRSALAVAAVAAGLIVASCEAPRPEPLAPRTVGEKARAYAVPEDGALDESQVAKPVTLARGSVAPRYPDILRQAGVSGEALVSFVVNANGTADTASFKVIRSTHELFATAVKKALPEMRFTPAEAGGRKVKQLVEQPFTFTIVGSKQPSADTSAAPGTLDEIAISAVPPRKGVAVIRRRNEEVPATSITVVIYSNDGREVARGENLLQAIDPQSIQSIEVWKPSRCPANVTCPLIKIVLEKGTTLGGSPPIRSRRRDETIADARESRVEYPVASTMNVELLTSSGEVIARWPNRPGPGTINSEDITASEAYYGKYCKAGSPCPLTRIWLKPGREVAYKRG